RQEDSTGPPLPRATPLILVLARLNDEPARKEALALAADAHSQTELRISMLQLLGELAENSNSGTILSLIKPGEAEPVQLAALGALQSMPNADVRALLNKYPAMNSRVRSKTRDVLLSRKEWALALLKAIDSG